MVRSQYFLQKIQRLVLKNETHETDVVYFRDFNIWVDDIRNNIAQNFLRLLINFKLVKFVSKPKYNSSHTLDLVITINHH